MSRHFHLHPPSISGANACFWATKPAFLVDFNRICVADERDLIFIFGDSSAFFLLRTSRQFMRDSPITGTELYYSFVIENVIVHSRIHVVFQNLTQSANVL